MKLTVKVTYKDDTAEEFDCVDFPSVSDFVYLYLAGFKRLSISKDGIAKIETDFKHG